MPGHLYAGVQELVKVFAELPGGHGQLAAGASGGVNHLARRLVQVCSRLVQLALGLLEGLGGWRDLMGEEGKSIIYFIHSIQKVLQQWWREEYKYLEKKNTQLKADVTY